VCVPIDVNDQNVLAIPKEWARRHTQ
jgi:hypothetical protein